MVNSLNIGTRQDPTGKLEVYHDDSEAWVPVIAPLQVEGGTLVSLAEPQSETFDDILKAIQLILESSQRNEGLSPKVLIQELKTFLETNVQSIRNTSTSTAENSTAITTQQLPSIATVLNDLKTLTTGLSSITSQINTLLGQVGTKVDTSNSTTGAINTFLTTINTSVNNVIAGNTDINTRLTTSNTSLATANTNLGTINSSIGTTNTSLGNLNTLVGTSNTSFGTANNNLTTINSSIGITNTTLGTTNTNLLTINTSVGTTNTTLGTTNNNLTTINNSLGTVNTSIGTTNTTLGTTNTNLTNIRSALLGTGSVSVATFAETIRDYLGTSTGGSNTSALLCMQTLANNIRWQTIGSPIGSGYIFNAATTAASATIAFVATSLELSIQCFLSAAGSTANIMVELRPVSGTSGATQNSFYLGVINSSSFSTGSLFPGVEPMIIPLRGEVQAVITVVSITSGVTLTAWAKAYRTNPT